MQRRALLLPAAVSVAALAAVVWWASRQQMPELPAASVALPRLAAALGLYALATALRGERWLRLSRRCGAQLQRTDAYAITTVGYMGNNALSARAGDVMKAVLSPRQAGSPTADGFGTLVAERVLDALALVLVFALLVTTLRLPLGVEGWMLALVVGGVLALSVALWLVEGWVYAVLGAVAGLHLALVDGLYVMARANLVALLPAAP